MKNVKKGFKLTEEEIEKLRKKETQLKKRITSHIKNRIRAILLVGAEGKRHKEVAQICKVKVRAIGHWLARYREEGVAGLKDRERPGTPKKLTNEQLEELRKIIEAGPAASGLDTGIWSCLIISDIVKKKFDIEYSLSQISRILHKLGFTYQSPKKNSLVQTQNYKKNGWIKNCRK